jgi:hypothetical protein
VPADVGGKTEAVIEYGIPALATNFSDGTIRDDESLLNKYIGFINYNVYTPQDTNKNMLYDHQSIYTNKDNALQSIYPVLLFLKYEGNELKFDTSLLSTDGGKSAETGDIVYPYSRNSGIDGTYNPDNADFMPTAYIDQKKLDKKFTDTFLNYFENFKIGKNQAPLTTDAAKYSNLFFKYIISKEFPTFINGI